MRRRIEAGRRARARAAGGVLAAVLGLAACSGAGKRETSALLDAVDHYRRAEGLARDTEGRAVASVACTAAGVCDAKRVCLDAIEPTTRALAIKDEVGARLADIEQKRLAPDAAEASALPSKLDEAQKLLEAGRLKMTECERKLAELRVRYGG